MIAYLTLEQGSAGKGIKTASPAPGCRQQLDSVSELQNKTTRGRNQTLVSTLASVTTNRWTSCVPICIKHGLYIFFAGMWWPNGQGIGLAIV